ncbi:cation diffusion facilitator family transporter [Streptomyces clavuligerus]|uniref:cation diffusion facilitator family transporter n=1 Tax=Streptomyces clavuligerus TaxID=1901 RepID=UPI001E32D9C8|nr:cation diffusion facilitator family transporter [Streptomyces clavuligerus]
MADDRTATQGHSHHGDHEHRHHGHDHDPAQTQTQTHDHRHRHGGRWPRTRHGIVHLLTPHGHRTSDRVDPTMEASHEGMRTLWISLVILGATTVVQAAVVALSGSVALLGDTVHNAADALTAVPLGIAFLLGRRAANRRYTYGYGRAEDLAGVVIVLTIAGSAALAAHQAVDRLLDPRDISHLPAVAAAAVVGFAGNEWVARYRIRTAAASAPPPWSPTDCTPAPTDSPPRRPPRRSLPARALGWHRTDPVVGLLITVAILTVSRAPPRKYCTG